MDSKFFFIVNKNKVWTIQLILDTGRDIVNIAFVFWDL